MTKLVDLALIVIILICGWCGYKKGLIMGIGGIIAIILSLFAAKMLTESFSYELVPVMRPFASGYMETIVNEEENGVLATLEIDRSECSLTDMIEKKPDQARAICTETYRRFGIETETAETMTDEAITFSVENDRDLLYSLSEVLCQRVSKAACLVLAFLLILIVLTVLGNIPNIGFKLPNLDILNDVGGTVLGVVKGVAFCILIAWCLRYLGLILGNENLEGTWLASRLMSGNPVVQIFGI